MIRTINDNKKQPKKHSHIWLKKKSTSLIWLSNHIKTIKSNPVKPMIPFIHPREKKKKKSQDITKSILKMPINLKKEWLS